MQKNKKNLLIGGVIVIGLVLVVGLAMALNQGSSSLQGFLSNKFDGVKRQNNSQTLYKGACQVRIATNPNLAKYDDSNYGLSYAKIKKGQKFNSLDLVRAACAESDYINLLNGSNGQFCQNNPGAQFAKEVVLYNADGTPNTDGYFAKNAPLSVCPQKQALPVPQYLYKGACQVRIATNPNLVKYDAADYGPGYAKVGKGQNFNSLDLVRAACTDTDYSNLLKGNNGQFCQNNPGAAFAQEVVLYNADGTPNTSGYSVKGQGPVFACSVTPAPGGSKNNAQNPANQVGGNPQQVNKNPIQPGAPQPANASHLVVQKSANLHGGQINVGQNTSLASFDVISNFSSTLDVKSLMLQIIGSDLSNEQNITNYGLYMSGNPNKLADGTTIFFGGSGTLTFDNIQGMTIAPNSTLNFIIKANTENVLSGLNYTLGLQQISFNYLPSNVSGAPALFNPSIQGQTFSF